ncbi:hypothetical protein HPP92_022493 [Vanilla planifolia]|uniref:Multiple C2 domain-containing protein n=1 Tax=Vanilla planifolia TaxID=51239 RepID=A0A835PSB1_VANPL|nr:hypothetical protein HPP92_022493 [Vanilla planifolia]
MDTKLSLADAIHPDELGEECDTFPTTQPPNIVKIRYDRLRSVAGRVQMVVGDLAAQGRGCSLCLLGEILGQLHCS